ncbi:MAG: DNA polymerase IV, partial [Actinomycetota bacterium]
DEAFMEVETDEPERLARDIQGAVLHQTKLWCSIGVGDNKLRAKIASGFAKPAGVYRLTRENWSEVMGRRTVDALWGIGKKTAAKLDALGIQTVDQLAGADDEALARAFGPRTGPWLRQLGTGEDATPVTSEPYVPKARGRERTYQRDITDPDEVRREVAKLARAVVEDLKEEGRAAVRVVVKVRFAPFFTSTHGVPLPEPTMDPQAIEAGSLAALAKFELDRPVRLLGVRAEMIEKG